MRPSFRVALAVMAGAIAAPAPSQALTVPFTEGFVTDNANWRDGNSNPLACEPAGGPDGSSHVTGSFNYLGFTNPFGGGPVVFRGQQGFGSSGGAFVGDWLTGGVRTLTAFVRHDAPVALTYFLRLATAGNFPGAAWDSPVVVEPDTWTRITFDLDPSAPCTPEFPPPGGSCAAALASVGNVQIGTSAPEALTMLDEDITLDLDRVSIVPEPGTGLLAALGLSLLGALGRRR